MKIKAKIPKRYLKRLGDDFFTIKLNTEAAKHHIGATFKTEFYHVSTYIAYIAAEEYGRLFYECYVKHLPVATGLLQLSAKPVGLANMNVRGHVTVTSLGTSHPVFGWEDPKDWKTRIGYLYYEPNPNLVEVEFVIPYKNWKRKPMRVLSFGINISREAYDEPDFVPYAQKHGIQNYDVVAYHVDLLLSLGDESEAEFYRRLPKARARIRERSIRWLKQKGLI